MVARTSAKKTSIKRSSIRTAPIYSKGKSFWQRGEGVWKFRITEDIEFSHGIKGLLRDWKNPNFPWVELKKNGKIIVKGTYLQGYAWDGCTPKFNFLDLLIIGTPDGIEDITTGLPKTYYASLIHDVLLQAKVEGGLSISRGDADRIFLKYLGNFRLKYLYFVSVFLFGRISEFVNLTRYFKKRLAT